MRNGCNYAIFCPKFTLVTSNNESDAKCFPKYSNRTVSESGFPCVA